MGDGGHHPVADDGHRLHGLCAALGPDEFLGCHCDHQSVLSDPAGGRGDRELAVGRLFHWQPDTDPFLRPPLPVPLPYLRRGVSPSGSPAHGEVQQSAGYRRHGAAGHHPLPSLLHGQGFLRFRRFLLGLSGFRVLRPRFLRRARQLHPGKPAGDPAPYRARMVFPALLRHPAGGARYRGLRLCPDYGQVSRRYPHVRFDPDPVLAAVA